MRQSEEALPVRGKQGMARGADREKLTCLGQVVLSSQ